MMGGRNSLKPHVASYIKKIQKGDKDAAGNLYLFLSPLFFYIHILFEIARTEWRNAISWSGMFCERIVNNLLREISRKYSTDIFRKLEKSKFENKLGKLKSELEARGFKLANELFHLIGIIYSLRDTRGPHDVPPPEPLRAQISASQCLLVYIDYLEALIFLRNNMLHDYKTFISFFSNLTETKISLTFREKGRKITVEHVLKNVLYREGFFGKGRKLSEVQSKLKEIGYNFADSTVSSALCKLSKGKDAILIRKGKRKKFTYHERYPPKEIFTTII